MKEFHSTELTRELQKVIDLVLNSVQEGEPIDIAKNKIDEEAGNASFVIDIEDLAFFYHSEQERDEDFETLKHYISLPESKEIKTQEVSVTVQMVFEVDATKDKEEIKQVLHNWIESTMLLMDDRAEQYQFIDSTVIQLKEEAEIYGND